MPTNKVQKKVVAPWTEANMKFAIAALQANPALTKRGVAKQYGVAEATLRRRLKLTSELKPPCRKPAFDQDVEDYHSMLY